MTKPLHAPPARDGLAWGCLPVLLLGLGLLAVATWLKESPLFWRHAGGYPVWLRESVAALYFPWMGLCFAALSLWQVWILGAARQSSKALLGAILSAAILWGLLGACVGGLVWNNLDNLSRGSPWHAH